MEFGRQRRGEFQMERRESELRRRSRRDDRRQPAAVQRVVLCRRSDERDRHRELHAVDLAATNRGGVGAVESAGLGRRREDLSRWDSSSARSNSAGRSGTDTRTTTTNSPTYTVIKGVTIPVAQFAGSFTDPNYYDGSYPWPSQIPDFTQIQSYVTAHPEQFTFSGGPGPNKSSFDLTERVTAGYVMNSMDLAARVRLVTGVRIESTHVDTRSFQASNRAGGFQGRRQLHGRAAQRVAEVRHRRRTRHPARLQQGAVAAESRGHLARRLAIPESHAKPADGQPGQSGSEARTCQQLRHLVRAVFQATRDDPGRVLLQVADAIRSSRRRARPTTGEWAGFLVSQPGNAGSATLQGFEVAYQQHLSFPAGSAGRVGLVGQLQLHDVESARDTAPDRQPGAAAAGAEHVEHQPDVTTADACRSALGVSYNGANIYAYQYQNLNSDGTPMAAGDLTAGGTAGPGGDNYLYAHLQIDAQAVDAGRARASRWSCPG